METASAAALLEGHPGWYGGEMVNIWHISSGLNLCGEIESSSSIIWKQEGLGSGEKALRVVIFLNW